MKPGNALILTRDGVAPHPLDSPVNSRLLTNSALAAGESWHRTLVARKCTLLLAMLAVALHILPTDSSWLVLSRDNLARGWWWTLLTGSLLHVSAMHVTMDVLGLLVVGWVFEPLLARPWPWLIALINIAVGLGVLALYPNLDAYCGLSALDQGLLAAGVVALFKRGDRLSSAIIAVTLATKWAFEIAGGLPLMGTLPSDPLQYGQPVPLVHALGGAAGAIGALFALHLRRE